MSADRDGVFVRLTSKQLAVVRSVVSVAVEEGYRTRVLGPTVGALDAAQPSISGAELRGLFAAVALLDVHADDDPETYGRNARSAGRAVHKIARSLNGGTT